MKKVYFLIIISVLMMVFLAACNTEEAARNRKDTNNLENVSFGPGDQGIQPHQDAGETAPGQNRVDANIPYEGLNPNGPNGSIMGLDMYEQADRYKNQGDDHLGSNKERIDQVNGAFQSEVVQLTNQARKKNGLKPLKNSAQVAKVAQKKAEDMAENKYFSHTSPTYGTPFDMLKEFGVEYRIAAENIAAGQQTPDQVVKGWLNSPNHRRNIMNKNLTHIGVGFDEDGQYWTQMFIREK
ncbi:CAP domain-containing protein [Halobacillus yeomjeoni]|uniref:CAP domain-containing protein n=1 Tax=Halobacillus yeomjeoni TaxID=311194 RepID=UPI001CD51A79|nr:CAP domain-containing protein [Halobacillus yeomjeoni]MCA0984764.1 CAP domain-containing protein [Halobacillus yeomjeoni]